MNQNQMDDALLNKKRDQYWKKVFAVTPHKKSIRKLKKSIIIEANSKWTDVDLETEVAHNFANVQCLNCHSQHEQHPEGNVAVDKIKRKAQIKSNCISCHNSDQSPHWYSGTVGKNASLNKKKFEQLYKSVSCPKIE